MVLCGGENLRRARPHAIIFLCARFFCRVRARFFPARARAVFFRRARTVFFPLRSYRSMASARARN